MYKLPTKRDHIEVEISSEQVMERARQVTDLAEAGYDSSLLVFLSIHKFIDFLRYGIGHFIFFPIVALFALLKPVLSGIEIYKAKNKNLGRVGTFALDLLSNGLFAIAIIGGVAGIALIASVATVLIAASMVISFLYNFGMTIFHGYRWYKAKDDASRGIYKSNFIKHGIGATLSLVLLVALGLMMVLKAPAIAITMTCAAFGSVDFVVKAVGFYRSLRADKRQEAEARTVPSVGSASDLPTRSPEGSRIEVRDERALFDYHQQENRAIKMHDITEKESQRLYLKREIKAQLVKILNQMKENSWSTFFESSKRSAKIEVLRGTLLFLLTEEELAAEQASAELPLFKENPVVSAEFKNQLQMAGITSYEIYLKHKDIAPHFASAYQSFFRKVGDTEDIIDATKQFFGLAIPVHHRTVDPAVPPVTMAAGAA